MTRFVKYKVDKIQSLSVVNFFRFIIIRGISIFVGRIKAGN